MKVALIGHGMVSGTHLAALYDSNMVNLHGILGSDVARARTFGGNHCADAMVYPGLAELCADTSLDFAIVTTPPNARKDIVDALVDAGLPILMEKPVERTLKAATEIAVRCKTGGVVAGIVFQHRVRESSQALKTAIARGDLGELVAAEIRVPWWRDQGYYDQAGRGTYARDGGGVVISQAIHTLDLAIWLMGPVGTVQAMMATTALHELEAENWAGGLLRFANGAVATLTATTSFYPGGQESIRVQGTRAHAHLEGGVLTVSYLDGRVEHLGETASGTGGGADPMAFTHAWHQAIIEDFANSIEARRAPLCTMRDGLRVHAVIDAMERSSKLGQTVGVVEI